MNEDYVAPGQGFGTHGHRDMEIISYVVEGQLAHKDSTGVSSTIRPGDVQRMSAGTGVRHSEFNPSDTEPTHFLQIWILPEQEGLPPSYEQRAFPEADRRGTLRLVAARDGQDGAVTVHQDVRLYLGITASWRGAHPSSGGRPPCLGAGHSGSRDTQRHAALGW